MQTPLRVVDLNTLMPKEMKGDNDEYKESNRPRGTLVSHVIKANPSPAFQVTFLDSCAILAPCV